jgi:tetratricopeptide (TPR) repeat protein
MMKLVARYFLWLCMLTGLLMATPPPNIEEGPTNNFHLYFWGYYNDLSAQHQIAKKCYEAILRSCGSTFMYPGYIHHLFNTKQYEKIVSMIPQIEAQFPKQLDIQLLIIKALELSGKQSQADKRLMALSHSHPENAELVYFAAAAHVRANHPEDAVNLIDTYLKAKQDKSSSFIFYFMKAQIFFQLMQKDAALSNIARCTELNPNFEQGWLLSGLLNELGGNIDNALISYRNFLSIVGHDPNVERQILNLMLKKENTKLLPHNDTLLDRAFDCYYQKQFLAALELAHDYLLINPQDESARILKIELMGCLRKTRQAVTLVKQWIDENPNNPLWYRILHLMYLNKSEQKNIIDALNKLTQTHPTISYSFFYLIEIALKKNNITQALYYLNQALTCANDAHTKAQLLYQLAIIYYEKHQWALMLDALKTSISLKEDFAPSHHLLAYYYSQKDNNFKLAQSHIDKALSKESGNQLYLNTQARIWYKQKQFHKAPDLISLHGYQIAKKMPKLKYVQKLEQKYKEFTVL